MRALTVVPKQQDSLAVTDVPDPEPADGDLLVDGLAVGVCGTDREIAHGDYGWAPPGRDRLVIGHESLGRVRRGPPWSGLTPRGPGAGGGGGPRPPPCRGRARGPVCNGPAR